MKKELPFMKLTRLIKSYGYNSNNLSMFLPHSRPTMQYRLTHPSELTLSDIQIIIHDGQISWDEVSEAIRKDME